MTKRIKRLLVHFGAMLLLVSFFEGCSSHEQPPEDLLTKAEMVKTMTEIYLTEQRLSSMGLKRDSLNQIFSIMKDKAFVRAGTSDSTFKRSLEFYARTPTEIDEIYTALIDTLNLHEQRMISNQVKK